MKVSIVIPNYNGEKFLDICLKSLYSQEYKDFEIIIVDNASTDNSIEYLQNLNNIKLIKLDKNYGFSKAVNEGIKAASGEFVVLLNNDTEATKSWLKNLVKCIEKDNKIFSCSSKMLRYHEKNLIDDAGDEYNILGWSYKRGDGKDKLSYGLKDKSIFSSCGGAAIYRKSTLKEIGLFDEDFFAYLEDIDISYRALIFGYKNLYCSTAEVYHIGSATSGSRYNDFKARLTARNNLFVIYKNMPLLQLIINFPFIVIGFLIKFIFYDQRGLGKEYSQGIFEGSASLKNINKVKFSFKNILNYIKIEIILIKNVFIMMVKA